MSDLRYLVLTPDGELVEQTFVDGQRRTILDELYKAINCDCVDVVRLGKSGHEASMFIDDNGMIIDLPMVNEYATVVTYAFNKEVHQFYYGTAVFLGVPTEDGDEASISVEAEAMIRAVVTKAKSVGVTLASSWTVPNDQR